MEIIKTQNAICDQLLELADLDKNVYLVDTDLSLESNTSDFYELFQSQHINVGLAEQNAIGIASGLAATGKIPFLVTHSQLSLHALEQIKYSVCYNNLNIKILSINSGITQRHDGSLKHCTDDIAMLRNIPNLAIVTPTDYNSARKLIAKAYKYDGPVYMRFSNINIPNVYPPDEEFDIGRAIIIKTGFDICIMTTGDTFAIAKKAADQLESQGILVSLLDIPTIKPLDTKTIMQQIDNTSKIITIENHNITNGLGSAICELVATNGKGIVRRIGINDNFYKTGTYEELMELNGITVENILNTANELLADKI